MPCKQPFSKKEFQQKQTQIVYLDFFFIIILRFSSVFKSCFEISLGKRKRLKDCSSRSNISNQHNKPFIGSFYSLEDIWSFSFSFCLLTFMFCISNRHLFQMFRSQFLLFPSNWNCFCNLNITNCTLNILLPKTKVQNWSFKCGICLKGYHTLCSSFSEVFFKFRFTQLLNCFSHFWNI